MDISLKWLNRYLSPGDLGVEEADRLLTQAGFPIEQTRIMDNGDVVLDVEVTSNRGDCLSHIGCAREIAAMHGASKSRRLVYPEPRDPARTDPIDSFLALENRHPDVCPLFTAHLIRGCQVGPSPAWLVEALEAVGQRSINNVVDVTNFITFEFGNPCHVFDLAKLAGPKLVIRFAERGEPLTTLDGKARTLESSDLVVADAERATSLAGVIGGQDSEVDESTTDVVFEMATWDPITIRSSARRMGIRTDAGYRFERGVHPGTIAEAARRAVALICELTGGLLCKGHLAAGAAIPAPVCVSLRPSRAERIIGIRIPVSDSIATLRALEIEVEQADEDELACTIPPHRLDLTREIDLIEEIARTRGLDLVPTADRLSLRPRALQASERAVREIGAVLTGLGFYETVTFSFTSPEQAEDFLVPGAELVNVDDERRKAEPTLRPSVLPGLLQCRRANRDAGVWRPGGVRLFELAASFAQDKHHRSLESRSLAMLMDVPGSGSKRSSDDVQTGVRLLRGAIDELCRAMLGHDARVDVEPCNPNTRAWDRSAFATVSAGAPDSESRHIGWFGLIAKPVLDRYGLDTPVLGCELVLDELIAMYPPIALAERLPAFPAIQRDLSLIVPEQVLWAQIERTLARLNLEFNTHREFVGAFRGKQIGAGRKSVTVRLHFRDPARTLRHDEVDPQVERAMQAMKADFGAEIRA
ncbi:MAG: phenylalanine--tRNA ligase subunit beta [Planctomycetota bacterium]|nr:MAG: phenylalanine--tRNA ligase subunit beta [Planctomycetota bacterium]